MVKKATLPVLFVGLLVLASGCDFFLPPWHGGGGQQPAHLVVVKLGERARLGDGQGYIEYVELVSESRCPRGADCVRAGEAIIRVAIVHGDAVELAELTIPGFARMNDPNLPVVHVGGYALTLVRLDPYPDVLADPFPGYSVATIRVGVPMPVDSPDAPIGG